MLAAHYKRQLEAATLTRRTALKLLVWPVCAVLWLACTATFAGELVVYPRPESDTDQRSVYTLKLLQLALDEAHADYSLRPSSLVMRQNRSFEELAAGRSLRVVWAMSTAEREARLQPIRIPISKGLIGWRLNLVNTQGGKALSGVRKLAQFQGLTAGQGLDWPDTGILQANGVRVVPVSSYDNLFKMLTYGRFDVLPRSLTEIWAEAQTHQAEGIVIDPHVVLHYPAADYFFVNKQDVKLAAAISTGLERALANGKFDRLFYSFYGAQIRQAQLAQRTVIELHNPQLPEGTPLGRKALWFDPLGPVPAAAP
jgi:ABC-type amino acid transport substrate-binding protein